MNFKNYTSHFNFFIKKNAYVMKLGQTRCDEMLIRLGRPLSMDLIRGIHRIFSWNARNKNPF